MLMRKFLKPLVLAGFMTIAGSAMAADLPPVPGPAVVPPSAPASAPVEESAWYVRGDAGIGISDVNFLNAKAFAAGFGIGYKYNNWLRTDVTFDYAGTYKGGRTTVGVVVLGAGTTTNEIQPLAEAYSVMLNGYVDIPTNTFVTPYIGGGIGWGEVVLKTRAISTFVPAIPGPNTVITSTSKNTDDGLALALNAGLTFDLSSSIALDASYKYRMIMISGPDWHDHLLRGGLRFYFN